MKILLNGTPDLVSPEPGSTLKDVLEGLRSLLRDQKVMGIDWKLDGQALTRELETAQQHRPATEFTQLEVTARDPLVMCGELLTTLEVTVEWLQLKIKEVTPALATMPMPNFQAVMQTVLERLMDMRAGFSSACSLANISPNNIQIDGSPFERRIQDLARLLADVQTYLRNADRNALRDAMEFDLADRLVEWRRVIQVMREKIAEQLAKPE